MERQYFIGGYTWEGENQLDRFIVDGIWENGYGKYNFETGTNEKPEYQNIFNTINVGDYFALKSVFTQEGKSILRISIIGIVSEITSTYALKIGWLDIPPFDIIGLGYIRNTLTKISKPEEIEKIFGYIKRKDSMNNYKQLLEANYNLILTGAPGTGKTFLAKQIAMQMIGVTNEKELEESGRFEFVQFHPSYDYTDFVEGLRPTKLDASRQIGFELKNGIFKKFCGGVDIFDEAWANFIKAVEKQKEKDGTHYEVKTLSGRKADKKKRENGETSTEAKSHEGEYMELEINSRGGVDNVTGGCHQGRQFSKEQCYKVYCGLLGVDSEQFDNYRKAIVEHLKDKFGLKNYGEKHVFVIDEINRGEISKIFGELFFSIDPGYRGIKGAVKTQYSNMHDDENEKFYVPENVFIIGTMNDIDRSVESFDFAMRRRFTWVEIKAKASQIIFKGKEWEAEAIERMDNLNNAIWNEEKKDENEKKGIEGLNSSYHIGGAYFLKLDNYKEMEENNKFEKLWEYHLEPLLKEYLRGMPDAETKLSDLEKAYNPENNESVKNVANH